MRLAGLSHGAGLGRDRGKGRVHRDRGGQRLPSGGGTGHHSLPRAESGHFLRCRGGAGSPSAPCGKPGLFPGHPHGKWRSGHRQAHTALFRRSQSDASGRDASPLDIWGDTDADTLEGVYFRLLREAMEADPDSREEIQLAAEISRKLLEGREVTL